MFYNIPHEGSVIIWYTWKGFNKWNPCIIQLSFSCSSTFSRSTLLSNHWCSSGEVQESHKAPDHCVAEIQLCIKAGREEALSAEQSGPKPSCGWKGGCVLSAWPSVRHRVADVQSPLGRASLACLQGDGCSSQGARCLEESLGAGGYSLLGSQRCLW